MSDRVVIVVSGGCVQGVYSDVPLEVLLVDWDNIKEAQSAPSLYDDSHRCAAPIGLDGGLAELADDDAAMVAAYDAWRRDENAR